MIDNTNVCDQFHQSAICFMRADDPSLNFVEIKLYAIELYCVQPTCSCCQDICSVLQYTEVS